MTFLHTVFIALTLSWCYAFDKPKLFQSQIELDQAAIIQNIGGLQDTIDLYDVNVPDNGCPVCKDVGNEEADRFIKKTLTRANGLLRRSSTFTSFKRFMRTKLGRRQYNTKVSVETILPMLNVTGSHFFAISTIGSEVKSNISDDFELKARLVDLLEGLSKSSATFLTNITNMLERSNTTTAGVVTMSILSILELYESVTLSTTSVVVDYLNVIAGVSVDGFPKKVHSLRDSLSTNGVFAQITNFLRAKRDQSGLIAVLVEASTSIADIGLRLDRFMETADIAIASSTTTGDTFLQSKSTAGTENLIAGIMAAVVTSSNYMALESVNIFGVMVGSVLGLLVARIDGILTLFVSTVRSVVVLAEADNIVYPLLFLLYCLENVKCILLLPLAILTWPIWVPILIILNILSGPDNQPSDSPFSCQLEALTCQNNALSAALSLL